MSLFLCLQGNTYHYRKAVPSDLRCHLGKQEIKKSLRTGNKLEAQSKALLLNEKVTTLLNKARGFMKNNKISTDEKRQILKTVFHQTLAVYDKVLDDSLTGYRHMKFLEKFDGYDFKGFKDFEKNTLNEALEKHKNKKFFGVRRLSKYAANKCGIDYPMTEMDGNFLNEASLANIDAHRLIYARSQGENPAIPEKYRNYESSKQEITHNNTSNETTKQSSTLAPDQLKTAKKEEYPLSKVIEDYTIDRESAGKWSEKTKSENHACYNNFLEFAGENISCAEIDYHLVRDYRTALTKLPANRNKSKQYRNKSIQEVLEMNVKNPMSKNTVNKNINRLASLFKFAVKLEKMNVNPAEGLEITVPTKDSELRAAYTNDDLMRLFNSDEYLNDSFKKSFMFWVIPIALFTGMRQTEIAQLHIHDIKKEGDIWYIDINDDTKTKKLKNKNSKRKIPLHDFLSKTLNLPAYAEKLKEDGHKRLFPELNYGRDGYGQAVSRWFNGHGAGSKQGYKALCGIESTQTSKKDFHSLRHTAIDHLKQKQVDLELLHEFDGHSFGSMTMDRYGKAYHLETIYEKIVSQISFDQELDLTHLMKSKYVL